MIFTAYLVQNLLPTCCTQHDKGLKCSMCMLCVLQACKCQFYWCVRLAPSFSCLAVQ